LDGNSNWIINSIKEISDVKGGKRLPKGHGFSEDKTKYPYIRVVDFKDGNIKLNNIQYLKKETYDKISRYIISSDDVYISIAGTIGLVGKVPKILNNSNLTENAAKIVLKQGLEQDYLIYYLSSMNGQKQINKLTGKTSQPKLALSRIEKILVPVPPLVEQRGIAEVLGTVDEDIKRTDAVIEKAEELKMGLMQRLLTRGIGHTEFKQTELGEIPKTWEISQGVNLFKTVGGYAPNQIKYTDNDEADTLFLKVSDMNNEANLKYIVTSENKFWKKENPEIKFHKPNIIVIAKRGAAILQNRVRILNKESTFDPNLMGLVPNTKINIEFLYYSLEFKKLYTLIENAGIPQLNNKQLYPLKFALPSITEQKYIVEILNKAYENIQDEKNRKKRLEDLKRGLMQDLLSGKIRVELRQDELHRISNG
jgi:type I restriction enzyme S subunit